MLTTGKKIILILSSLTFGLAENNCFALPDEVVLHENVLKEPEITQPKKQKLKKRKHFIKNCALGGFAALCALGAIYCLIPKNRKDTGLNKSDFSCPDKTYDIPDEYAKTTAEAYGTPSANATKLPGLEILDQEIANKNFHDNSFPLNKNKGKEKAIEKNPNNMQLYHIYNKERLTPSGGLPVICIFGTDQAGTHDVALTWQTKPYAWLSNFFAGQNPVLLGGKSAPFKAINHNGEAIQDPSHFHAEGIYGALTILSAMDNKQPDKKYLDNLNNETWLDDFLQEPLLDKRSIDPAQKIDSKNKKNHILADKDLMGQMGNPRNRNLPLLATVLAKFWNPDAAGALIKTDGAYLIEGNNWGDDRCGAEYRKSIAGNVLIYQGSNRLGITLMLVRELLKKASGSGNASKLKTHNDALEWYKTVSLWEAKDPATREPLSEALIQHGSS